MIFDVHFVTRVLVTLLCAGILSFALTPLVKLLAQKVGAMDVPKDSRRMHTVPIPRMGGLAIFIAFLLTVLVFSRPVDRTLKAVLLGAVMIVILGVFDDIYTLPAPLKLLVQVGAAMIVVFYGGCRIQYITNPFSSEASACWDIGAFSIPVTVFWIVAITNAVNFIDGLDGLACGVSCISALNMLVIALLVSENGIAVIMAAMAGACMGFIPYNMNPAKIFMGDTGSTFLGFTLAAVSIQGLFKFYAVVSFAVPFLLLGVPIFDICFAVIRRLAHGKNPMEADRGHVHHRLIDMGFSQKQAVAITYMLTAILGLAAVLLTTSGGMRALVLLGAVLVVGTLGLTVIFTGRPHFRDLFHSRKDTSNSEKTAVQDSQTTAEEAEETEQSVPDQTEGNDT